MVANAVAVLRQHGLRMELHPVHRVLDMADRHDLTVLRGGGYLETGRDRVGRNDQRVISGSNERAGKSREQSSLGMMDSRGLPVHGQAGANDLSSIGRSDALMTQTHTEQGNPGAHLADD